MDIAQEMLTMFNDDPDLLKNVITGDKLWLQGYDIEAKSNEEIKEKLKQKLLMMPKSDSEVFQELNKG